MMTPECHCATGVIVNNILNWPPCWFAVALEELIWSLYGDLGRFRHNFLLEHLVMQKQRSPMVISLQQHLPGPSEGIWTLGLAASCSNSSFRTRQMLMHEKPWAIPILFQRCVSAGTLRGCVYVISQNSSKQTKQMKRYGNMSSIPICVLTACLLKRLCAFEIVFLCLWGGFTACLVFVLRLHFILFCCEIALRRLCFMSVAFRRFRRKFSFYFLNIYKQVFCFVLFCVFNILFMELMS